jgi:hypothetical protein
MFMLYTVKYQRGHCNINSLHYWSEALATIGFTVSMCGDIRMVVPVISGPVRSSIAVQANRLLVRYQSETNMLVPSTPIV